MPKIAVSVPSGHGGFSVAPLTKWVAGTGICASRDRYQAALTERGLGEISTEIAEAGPFHYAEDYHQQYLAKNPNGYCGLGGTGVSCPVGLT